ncbi:phosphotransferase family enzyme [Actinoallomurus bryophytorum]|uniref:Phosphotransferase family enzyme n=2 Tax=Actinoallomurus bryophytorum TaxID=1490222 RepID=A0A543CBY4_9ACTN|nr:phosphotransferase family enzyme [Actinoallomurus bryophytorum]
MTRGVVRRGGRVLRPQGSWSASVHEYLRYLESAGFDGAPRLLGVEGDREVLTYLEGAVAADPAWEPGRGARLPDHARTEEALAGAARLIRRLHDVSRGFVPREAGYRFDPHPPGPAQVVSHGDLGPWNTVYRDGVPVAFIDWDAAGPVEPLVELASAAWAFVPLAPPVRLRESGFDPVPDLPARLRIFLDAYGLADRKAILPALRRCRLAEAARVAYAPVGPAEAAASLEFLARELRWLQEVGDGLGRAL